MYTVHAFAVHCVNNCTTNTTSGGANHFKSQGSTHHSQALRELKVTISYTTETDLVNCVAVQVVDNRVVGLPSFATPTVLCSAYGWWCSDILDDSAMLQHSV